MEISIEVTGEAAVLSRLNTLESRISHLEPALSRMAEEFNRQMAAVFASEGRTAGASWAALSPRYAAWKARRFPGKSILRRSDRLYSSLVGPTSDSIREVGPDYILLGTRVPYGIRHQMGPPLARKQRKILTVNRAMERRFLGLLESHVGLSK